MKTLSRRCFSTIAVFALSAALLAPPAAWGQEKKIPPAAEGEVDYLRDIQPILAKSCIKCHGPDEQESGFRLDSREAALKGGDVGKGIIPGKSAESPLIRYVSGVDKEISMPPEGEGEPLNPKQIGLLRAWIDQGVKWAEASPAAKSGGPALRQLKGQTKWVTALAFDAGWKSLATAGGETLLFKPGEVKVWDPASGEVRATLQGHEKTVWAVAFGREGKLLATGGYDKLVKVWDLAAGKERATLTGHANWVTCVAFSPDGSKLASGSEDATVKLWNVEDGKELATLKGHAGTVRGLAFSKDGRLLATASFDKTVKLWDVDKLAETATLQAHNDAVWAVSFSPDGRTLATGGADGLVKLWTLPEGGAAGAPTERGALSGHKNWISCLAFSPDGRRLATGSFDMTVRFWDAASHAELAALGDLKSTVWSVAFTQDGKSLALGLGAVEGEESTVKFWDLPRAERKF